MGLPHPPVSSSHRNRMAIDALLNPTTETETETNSPVRHTYTAEPYSPQYTPSPNEYYYPRFQGNRPYSDPSGTRHEQTLFSCGLRSSNSSPGPYDRQRYDSISSSSSTAGVECRRAPRPKYEEEEMYFIWYHRVDLCQEWKEVRENFNRQFPNRPRSGFQGIQCKFYRFIKDKKCPTLREQRRMRDGDFLRERSSLSDSAPPRFGVVEWTGVWYPWMREDKDQVLRRRRSAWFGLSFLSSFSSVLLLLSSFYYLLLLFLYFFLSFFIHLIHTPWTASIDYPYPQARKIPQSDLFLFFLYYILYMQRKANIFFFFPFSWHLLSGWRLGGIYFSFFFSFFSYMIAFAFIQISIYLSVSPCYM